MAFTSSLWECTSSGPKEAIRGRAALIWKGEKSCFLSLRRSRPESHLLQPPFGLLLALGDEGRLQPRVVQDLLGLLVRVGRVARHRLADGLGGRGRGVRLLARHRGVGRHPLHAGGLRRSVQQALVEVLLEQLRFGRVKAYFAASKSIAYPSVAYSRLRHRGLDRVLGADDDHRGRLLPRHLLQLSVGVSKKF